MHKLLVLYPEPADRLEFTTYYESVHIPLVQKLPGMLGCRYSLDLSGQDEGSCYFAVFEADFEDEQALARALLSPEGADVQSDVPNYATGGAVILSYPVAGSWSAAPSHR
ncbi:EthD family reductase [Micrococcaceae bacterium Sec7.4]